MTIYVWSGDPNPKVVRLSEQDEAEMRTIKGMDAQSYILTRVLPEFVDHFIAKNNDYKDKDGFEPHRVLGELGEFAGIWRKTWKLKKALIDGEELQFESARQLFIELIGHACLAIESMDHREAEKAQPAIKLDQKGPGHWKSDPFCKSAHLGDEHDLTWTGGPWDSTRDSWPSDHAHWVADA